MVDLVTLNLTREQALTVLGAVELQLGDCARELTTATDSTERDAIEMAMAQLQEAREVLRLVLFG